MEIRLDNVNYFNLKNLSFTIRDSKITFVLGESGSGKSNLLSLICDDINDYEGNIVRDISLNKIGFLRQNYIDYFVFNTVYEEFLYVLKKRKLKIVNYDKQMIQSLEMVGLNESFLNRSLYEMSKGEQKRVALAILLAQKFKVFVLDDPFTNLDFESKKRLIKLFKMMKIRYNKTIIIASCDTDIALDSADEVIYLEKGKLIFKGDKFDLFTNKKLYENANIDEPKLIQFSNLVKKEKNINIGFRDDINDLIKDIYRFVK